MKIITCTFYNRPDCARQMLHNLIQCDSIDDYMLMCGIEPGFPEVVDAINEYPNIKMMFLNERLLGCWQNKKNILTEAFKLTDYVIHLEDDILLAKDGLRYFEWAKKFGIDKSVFSVGAFAKEKQEYNINLVHRTNDYSPIGWATWKHHFAQLIADDWNGSDAYIRHARGHLTHIRPDLTRTKHIGYNHGIGTPQELLPLMKSRGQVPFAYAGLASVDGPFVPNRFEYMAAIANQLKVATDPELKKALFHQLTVSQNSEFNRQLLVNSKNEEWIKLDDTHIKTKAVAEYFQYETNVWSGDFEINEYHD